MRRHFCPYDIVEWDESFSPHRLSEMEAEFGEGPFRVVGVHICTDEVRSASPNTHPEIITFEDSNKRREQLSGDWFRKLPSPSAGNLMRRLGAFVRQLLSST